MNVSDGHRFASKSDNRFGNVAGPARHHLAFADRGDLIIRQNQQPILPVMVPLPVKKLKNAAVAITLTKYYFIELSADLTTFLALFRFTESHSPQRTRLRTMKKAIVPGLLLLIVFAIGLVVGKSFHKEIDSMVEPKTGALAVDDVPQVVAQGRLIPLGNIYNVTAPPGQRVDKYLVDINSYLTENVQVNKGEEIAVLAGHDLLQQQEKLAVAKKNDAMLELQNSLETAKANKIAADLALKQAELKLAQIKINENQEVNQSQLDNAQVKVDRVRQLLLDEQTRRLVSQQELIDRELDLKKARIELENAKKQIAQAKEAAMFAVDAARKNQALAAAALQRAQEANDKPPKSLDEAVGLASKQFKSSKIIAPAAGTLLKVFVKEGESVVNTPLLQIGNLDEMECIAEVSDRMVGRIKIGNKVTIRSPAFGVDAAGNEIKLTGNVKNIGRIVGESTLPSPNPLAMVDKKTVDVTITIDQPNIAVAKKLVNLQVSVKIECDKSPAADSE
jgi:HlyD family secretion protein